MSLFSVIIDGVTGVLWGLARRAARFSRKKTELEQLEEVAAWKLGHIGLTADNRRCLTCNRYVPPGDDYSKCPGPPATQRAAAQLRALKGKSD